MIFPDLIITILKGEESKCDMATYVLVLLVLMMSDALYCLRANSGWGRGGWIMLPILSSSSEQVHNNNNNNNNNNNSDQTNTVQIKIPVRNNIFLPLSLCTSP